MKTMKNLLFVAFAAIAISACQKEIDDNRANASTGEIVTFTASVDNALTKTAVYYKDGVESFNTLFTSDDKISVNGVKTEQIAVSDDRKTIEFSVEGVTGPYYAVTATHDKGYDPETQSYSIQYSGTGAPQKYRTVADGQYASFWSSADILAACGDSQNLQFKHMTTFYAITINKADSSLDSNIKSIYIRQGNGGNIAGSWKLSFEDNTPKLTPATLSALIGYDCGEEGVSQDATMIVGLPAYNYEEGLIFTIKDVNGNFASYKVPASKTQHAADGGMIIPFKPAFAPASGTIKTVEDWEAFAAAVNSKNDWDLYRWVGDGTVKLGANIEAENLTTITKKFPYVFDGCGYTITRTAATRPLFLEVAGEIKNLTLAGSLALTSSGSPFVYELRPGAKMTDCTNNMNVTFDFSDATTYVAGFAAVLPTTSVEADSTATTTLANCINNGNLTGATSYSQSAADAPYNVAIGGIIGDVRAGGPTAVAYNIKMQNCTNNGNIRFTPRPSDAASAGGSNLKAAMGLTGIGGVAGTFRSSKSIELDNCDNTGNITLSAEGMTNKNGMRPYAICLGGVIGCGTNQAGLGVTLNGHDITLNNCDNSGTLYNCGDNYSPTTRCHNKIYTGGLAGALVGLENNYASLQSCSNTGDVITYDLCSDDNPVPSVVSIRTSYNAVAGGFIGFGGWLNMDGCTVNCQIGNGKRQLVAWGGVIGYTVRPFILNNTTLHLTGYFQRISNYKMNRAVVAVVSKPTADDEISPNVTGSVISGTLTVSSSMKSSSDITTNSVTTNLSETLKLTMFADADKVKSNLVIGIGMATANTGVDITGLTINYSAN